VETTYDVIVLGGGPTGENVADRAHRGGLRTAVVEAQLVGGECSYWACIPSKALLRPAAARRAALAVDGAKEAVTGDLDMDAVFARRDYMTSHWSDAGQVSWLEGAGIALVRGYGRLAGPKTVEVTAEDGTLSTLRAEHAVVLSTGTVASVPAQIDGLVDARPWISRDATSARAVPRRLAILGGGVVAVEMATAFASFGSQVVLFERADRLLGGVEPFAGEMVATALRDLGADVRLGVTVRAVTRNGGTVTVEVGDGGSVEADEVLCALGRRPATDDIGLETVGLEPGGWIDVDDSLRVGAVEGGWLYAVGDINHRALLTHMGKYQGRVCGDVVAARARGEMGDATQAWSRFAASADHAAVAQVIFSDPEVAAVGLNEAAARAAGYQVSVVGCDMASISGAYLASDHYVGQAKLVVDAEREVVLGATFVGPDVAELLHSATIAVVGEVPIPRLWHAVASFPTVSEVWLRLLEAYGC